VIWVRPSCHRSPTLGTADDYVTAGGHFSCQPAKKIRAAKNEISVPEVAKEELRTMVALQPQSPAPEFAGIAVVDGQFKEIKLSDFKVRASSNATGQFLYVGARQKLSPGYFS
jgi:hypothetical protein